MCVLRRKNIFELSWIYFDFPLNCYVYLLSSRWFHFGLEIHNVQVQNFRSDVTDKYPDSELLKFCEKPPRKITF